MKQNEALDLMKMGKNIFLTGAPGSGKTYLLNQYIRYLKHYQVNIAVTASTGIAATHLKGITIHSWSGIGIKDHLNEKELEKILTAKLIKRNYRHNKVLIIDEISMLHKHQLEMIDCIARHLLEPAKSFGGLQVILCGDFFQLPPVSALNHEIQFAYEANAWEQGNFYVCYLQEQHRQGDDPLLTILNDMRRGTTGEHTKISLRTRYKKEPEGALKATRLYARNINVDKINRDELNHIPGAERTFQMSAYGLSAFVNGLKKGCLAPETLKLKIGAEVMFIKNDAKGQYVNGTRGVVVHFDQEEGWPLVKTHEGKMMIAYPETWEYEENEIVRASITQVPLCLAWAITIHKSQGMTLDAAEMDLGDVFELGMGYVALSRVRCLKGLKLMNLNELALKVHPRILQYDQILQVHSATGRDYLKNLSEKEKGELQQKTLYQRFGGVSEAKGNTQKKPFKKLKKKEGIPTHLITHRMLKENLSIEGIAEKRDMSVDTIINHLERLQSLKQIDKKDLAFLKTMISKADFEQIVSAFSQSEEGRLKPIYEKFEGKYSYNHIKLVRLLINHP